MQINLKHLSITNFKGIPDFTLDLSGNATIYGNNGAGKTTVKDAFTWLLFNKDSQGKADFQITPQDKQGNDMHNLETIVEAVLDCDGKTITLKKLYAEKWTKRRDTGELELTGHDTSYWIDEVPKKKGEYQTFVDSLIKEDLFKLITDPLYFNTQIPKWEQRRQTLFEIAGSVMSDDDIISSNAELAELPAILNDRNISDYKTIANEKLKNLEKAKENIPAKITENLMKVKNAPDFTQVEKELQEQKGKQQLVESKLMDFDEIERAYINSKQKITELYGNLNNRKFELNNETNRKANDTILQKNKLTGDIDRLKRENSDIVSANEGYGLDIEQLGKERAKLVEDWNTEKAKKFEKPEGQTCKSCGQLLPELTEEQIKELKNGFEKEQKSNIALINSKGSTVKTKLDSLNQKVTNNQAKLTENQEQINKMQSELDSLPEVTTTQLTEADLMKDELYKKISDNINILESQIKKPVESNTAELKQSKKEIEDKIAELNRQLGGKDAIETSKKRVEELKKEQKETAQQIAQCNKQLSLIKLFTDTKCRLLEDSINSKFKSVKFRLFDQQMNGDMKDCCITLINTNGSWVEFNSANNAGRINAGLDIIGIISNHYDVFAPIFVDNAESVTELAKANAQVIRLVVSESDNVLRVGREDIPDFLKKEFVINKEDK